MAVSPPAVVSTAVYVEYQYLLLFPAANVGAPFAQFDVKPPKFPVLKVNDVAEGVDGADAADN